LIYTLCIIAFIVELVFRFLHCKGRGKSFGYKAYVNAIGNKFNPLYLCLIGLALSFVYIYVGDYNSGLCKVIIDNFWILLCGSFVAILILQVLFSNESVTFIDAIAVIVSVGFASIAIHGSIMNAFPAEETVFAAIFIAMSLYLRAVSFSGVEQEQSKYKLNNYYANVYKKYDAVLPIVVAFITCAIFTLFSVFNNPVLNINISQLAASIIALAVLSLVLILACSFVYKIKSSEITIFDFLLRFMTYFALFSIPYIVYAFINVKTLGNDALVLVVTILMILNLIAAIAFQVVRAIFYAPIQYEISKEFDEAAFEEALNSIPEGQEAPAEEIVCVDEEGNVIENPNQQAPAEEVVYVDEEGNVVEAPAEEVVYVDEDGNIVEAPEEDVVYVDEEVAAVEKEASESENDTIVYVDEQGNVIEEVDNIQSTEEVIYVDEDGNAVDNAVETVNSEDEDEEDEEDDDESEYYEDEEYVEVSHAKERNVLMPEVSIIDENGEPKKIKRKFNTRMMFAPYEAKEYYNDIKNYLVMYRATSRYSARCETFRYKGLVAKVALAGKSIKVCLAIDPTSLEGTKYNFKDVSNKKQYEEVPTMIKVRSPRGLKYFKELVDIMMATRGVNPKRNYQPTNYLPYLIPNGEAILATIGMSTDYLYSSMNVRGIPAELPDDLIEYLPVIQAEELDEEEVEATIYLDTLCNHFIDGDEITIDVLKELHIISKGNVLRIKARGTLDRKLIIYAEYFDDDAIKMLMCTNCTVVKIIR